MILRAADVGPEAIAAAHRIAPQVFRRSAADMLFAVLVWGGFGALTLWCLWTFGFSPARLWNGLEKLAMVLGKMVPPTLSEGALGVYLYAMAQTVGMAFVGTLFAAVFGLALALGCAKNVLPNSLARFFFRRSSDFLRGVDQLIWALVFVRAVGLGPLAGVLSIIVSDIGTFAKLFSEAIENVERRQIDGVRACGAGAAQSVRFGIVPQVLPIMLSNVLYIFESNTRSATILGIVGAGGIGFYLSDRIRVMAWEEAASILIMILATVYAIDALSKWLRMKLIRGADTAAPMAH